MMGLARDIVRYAKSAKINPFKEDAAALIQADPAAALWCQDGDVMQRVLLAMQVLHIQRVESHNEPSAEFVATLPTGTEATVRPTGVVVREMLSGAHSQIMAVGYEITDRSFITHLQDAALQCPEILLLCDRGRGSALTLRDAWPRDRYMPAFYVNPARAGASEMASMHCKTLVVDGRDLLVTSANFTFHGLNENIEFGVRLRGDAAGQARDVFIRFIRDGFFVPLSESS